MKKLSFLIALCLLVTVGGVYATWNYAGMNITEHNGTVALSIGLAPTKDNSLNGELTFTNNNDVKILIDQDSSDPAHPYRAKLTTNGTLTLVFTPNQTIENPAAVMNVKYKVVLPDPAPTYNGKAIFVPQGTAEKEMTLNYQEDGTYTTTFDTTGIQNWIRMSADFELPTLDAYNKFNDYLKSANIVFNMVITAGVSSNPES